MRLGDKVKCRAVMPSDGTIEKQVCLLNVVHVMCGNDHRSLGFSWPVSEKTKQRYFRLAALVSLFINDNPSRPLPDDARERFGL